MRAMLCACALAASAGLTVSATASAFDGDLEPERGKIAQTFDGYPLSYADAVALDDSGRMLVAGFGGGPLGSETAFLLARYLPNGALDRRFGSDGIVVTDLEGEGNAVDVATDSSGRIVLAGTSSESASASVTLIRYLPNGTPDTSFGGDGVVVPPVSGHATGLAIDASDRIVVSGFRGEVIDASSLVARFTPDGTLDPDFSGDGLIVEQWGSSSMAKDVAIDASGRIVVAGYSLATTPDHFSRFAVARYQANGSRDASFGGTGQVTTKIARQSGAAALTIDSQGRIVAAGYTEAFRGTTPGPTYLFRFFALARYRADGTLDPSFDSDGKYSFEFGHSPRFDHGSSAATAVAIDTYGRIVVAGQAETLVDESFWQYAFAIARLAPSGMLDPGFSADGKALTDFGASAFAGARAAGLALAGGLRPVVVGWNSLTGFPVRESSFAIARYQGSPPPPDCPPVGEATIVGTAAPERINGTFRSDVILALGGDDIVNGRGGNDVICGGAGNDRLNGGGGADALLGEEGDDTLSGGAGRDTLVGGAGTDSYRFPGNDVKYP